MIRLSRRAALRAVAVLGIVVVVIALNVLANAGAVLTTSSGADLIAQRAAAERAVSRTYAVGVDQLRKTRTLKLAISDQDAAAIESRTVGDLRALRRSALEAIGQAYGLTGDAATQYAQAAETRLDGPAPAASAAPVMLAPRLFGVVTRMAELGGQISDRGIKEMTTSQPSQAPRPSATPSTPPVLPSATPRPLPSPTR